MSVERKWTAEEMAKDTISKKEIITFLHANCAEAFLQECKMLGNIKNVAKKPKEQIIECHEKMFETGAFKGSELDTDLLKKVEAVKIEAVEKVDDGIVHMKMRTIKKGANKELMPKVGDPVRVYYIGRIGGPDGKIFDQLMPKNRGSQTLNFKVGLGRVIRGWDEAILKMCVGETAGITIDPEWAYGKKGNLPTIQPNTTLYYQCTLETIG